MPVFTLRAEATVSCWTEVEADTLEEAIEEGGQRELAGLCYSPFSGSITEEWHFDNDGMAQNISLGDEVSK